MAVVVEQPGNFGKDRSAILGITNQMIPKPLVNLSYTAETPPERVRLARLLIDEAIQCKPHICLEIVDPGPAN